MGEWCPFHPTTLLPGSGEEGLGLTPSPFSSPFPTSQDLLCVLIDDGGFLVLSNQNHQWDQVRVRERVEGGGWDLSFLGMCHCHPCDYHSLLAFPGGQVLQ